MDFTLWLGFMIATVSLALMPGPDNIYVLTESIAKGPKQGVNITMGLISGVIVHTLLVATGMSLIIVNQPIVFQAVKIAGALYLFYLAYGAIKEKPIKMGEVSLTGNDSWQKLTQRGFLMNVLNPKVTLFFLALLPQFVSSSGWQPMYQMMVLGLTFMVISFIIFSSVALLAGNAAKLVAKPSFWVATKWIKVIVLLSLGLILIISER